MVPRRFLDPVVLAAAIETFEIVFHLVHNSTPQSANLDIPGDFQTVTATLALLELSRKLPIKRIVFVSSGGVLYGPAERFPRRKPRPPTQSRRMASANSQSRNT